MRLRNRRNSNWQDLNLPPPSSRTRCVTRRRCTRISLVGVFFGKEYSAHAPTRSRPIVGRRRSYVGMIGEYVVISAHARDPGADHTEPGSGDIRLDVAMVPGKSRSLHDASGPG